MSVYDSARDAEAAVASGETVDYVTQVRGDDGLTDDERRLQKLRRGEEAQRKSDAERARQEAANGEEPGTRGRVTEEGDGPSAGSKSDPSSDKTETNDDSTSQDPRSTAPTTEPRSKSTTKVSSTARSTGGSGKAKQ